MDRMKKAGALVLAGFLGLWAWAQVPPGYDAASFTRIGVGVRALGMAGAFTANT